MAKAGASPYFLALIVARPLGVNRENFKNRQEKGEGMQLKIVS